MRTVILLQEWMFGCLVGRGKDLLVGLEKCYKENLD